MMVSNQDSRPGDTLPTRPSLLARLKNRDDSEAWQRGWEEFYALYHGLIFHYARSRGLQLEDAQDVVQEIVAGVARRMPEFVYDPALGTFKTWLYRICRNKVVDHLRRRERAVAGPVVSATEERLAQVRDPNVLSPDQAWELTWETGLRQVALEQVARRVKPMTMRLYLYHVVDGHDVSTTLSHIADPKVSPETVHLAKHRVQRLLDETLTRLRQGRVGERDTI
jgi:RNA polymerase sigma factor (sigma-70 family)